MNNNNSYFRSSGYLNNPVILTESSGSLDLTELPPFLRTLLVTDGTVTKSLEAWFWENVNIKAINNFSEVLKTEIPNLEVKQGDKVLHREVLLKGENSNQVYAFARSTVSLKHLPDEIGMALEKGEIGIGELLREKGIETYRDIFEINYFLASRKNDTLFSQWQNKASNTEVLSRSYRIRVNGSPAIIVTEYFPVDIFKLPNS